MVCDLDVIVWEVIATRVAEHETTVLSTAAAHLRIVLNDLEAELFEARRLDQAPPRLADLLEAS
jgi:hypothetical protein